MIYYLSKKHVSHRKLFAIPLNSKLLYYKRYINAGLRGMDMLVSGEVKGWQNGEIHQAGDHVQYAEALAGKTDR